MGWRDWICQLVFITYFLLLCIALPLCIIELRKEKAPADVSAWFIGGLFVMAAIPISMYTILQHVIHYTKPYLQRHILRILWMVPIYALNAWFALKFPKQAIYLDTLRECYEAYVIYNFMAYLLNYLRHEYPDVEFMIEQKEPVKHLFPLCCFPPWQMGRKFIDHCRHGVLQYTVMRPITTVIAFICELCHVYGEGEFNFNHAYLYLMIVNNISQVWAMYCLIMFYKCCQAELKPMNPVWKFLCVKFVVFMSFWQGILFSVLAASGVIVNVSTWNLKEPKSIINGLQNFCICIEMFLAAVGHHYSFTYQPYVNPNAPYRNCCASCWSMCDVSDVKHDVVDHVRHVGNTVRCAVHRPGFTRVVNAASHQANNERSPLIHTGASDTDDNIGGFGNLTDDLYRGRLTSEDTNSIGSTSSLMETQRTIGPSSTNENAPSALNASMLNHYDHESLRAISGTPAALNLPNSAYINASSKVNTGGSLPL